ncbi:GNAT family N-acetyltransferase [Xylanimonas ulmi]|uniref:Ribosomal protein S18 acetylase RimI-like enzyme n=1 Tax=Xylanimonas ulmi TaxID=228973 RepID=A0A4Q7M208_9MICO|nr:GNAT family N-acetyltransferase [Xylanibacterium ulmi]RZS60847.1 ribosomal protein S18 acetylase RimI-like enzyme [Xylanibacterium ulmi]
MTGALRPYVSSDRAAVAEVCVRTAAAGGDARGRYSDDLLMPDVYALPYVDLEPESAFVVVQPDLDVDGADGHDTALRVRDGVVAGYVIATADTARFVERWRREWTPGFLARHPQPAPAPAEGGPAYSEAQLWHDGVHPERLLAPGEQALAAFPAHLHIDLLPRAQRQGWGRRMVAALCANLAARGVPGVHLSYDPANTGARTFYDRLGFVELPASTAAAPLMGLRTA